MGFADPALSRAEKRHLTAVRVCANDASRGNKPGGILQLGNIVVLESSTGRIEEARGQ